jgi:hypothetical protein
MQHSVFTGLIVLIAICFLESCTGLSCMTGGDFEIRQNYVYYRCRNSKVILEELKVDSFANNLPAVFTVSKSTHLDGNKQGESKRFYYTDCTTQTDRLAGQSKPSNECPFLFNKNTWYRVRHGNANVVTLFYVDMEGRKIQH